MLTLDFRERIPLVVPSQSEQLVSLRETNFLTGSSLPAPAEVEREEIVRGDFYHYPVDLHESTSTEFRNGFAGPRPPFTTTVACFRRNPESG